MTALAPAPAPAADPALTQRLTYPLASSYYRGWTSERALAELVANAVDEDPDFTFEYEDGFLTIEDTAHGIGDAGLVLGISNKSDHQIGQFGEGIQSACTVLGRDPAVGSIHVETVGYSFTPLLVRQRLITVGALTGRELPEVLALDIVANDRARGTCITVECPQRLADRVRQRFRHFQADYVPAPPEGLVIDDGGGTLSIGGVQVTSGRKLLFSYDFSLEQAKSAQNRDRTVIDSQVQDRLIRDALNHCADENIIEKWALAALAGTLSHVEQCFNAKPSPRVRRALLAVGKRLFADRRVCYVDAMTPPEASLYCRERGYEVIEDQLGHGRVRNLMIALGVPSASGLYRAPRRELTEWVPRAGLTPSERETLETAIELVRSVNGGDSLARVDAYAWTRMEGADTNLAFGGFYDPGSKRVGVHRENLSSLESTVRVLGHEAAHRRRHAISSIDYQDNSRGFEHELDGMLSEALILIHEHGLLDTLRERRAQKEAQAALESERVQRENAAREITHPAGLTRTLLTEALAARNYSQQDVVAASGVSAHSVRKMLRGGRRNGLRSCPAPYLEHTQAVSAALGLEWSIIHLGLLCEAGIHSDETTEWWSGEALSTAFTRRGAKRGSREPGGVSNRVHGGGRIIGARGDEIAACIARLRERGLGPDEAAAVDAQLQAPFDDTDGSWAAPYCALIASERERINA